VQLLLVEEQQQFEQICAAFSQCDVLAIDTEFVRTRTYYPNLGLIQVCDGKQLVLIDPVSVKNLDSFWQILANEKIIKVLHAFSEDLEVFQSCSPLKPCNMIDTQVCMGFLGFGISMGYAAMIEHFSGITLDKSESRTNWLKRPLTEKQIEYAAADVDHLFQWYPKIIKLLEEKNLKDIAIEESQRLIDKKFTATDETQLYLQVKGSWKLDSEQLNRLQFLANWRYQQAIKRNLPLSFVAKDHTLLLLAERNPTNVGAMANIEGIEILDVRHQGKALLAVLQKASKASAENYPDKIIRIDQVPGYKKLFAKIKKILQQEAEKLTIPMEMVASKKQINQLLSWHLKINGASFSVSEIDLLQGWRGQYFSKQLNESLQE
jgi:ribonuclease D